MSLIPCHQISEVNGKAEIFTGSGVPAWHGLGTTVEGTVTSVEALALANLDWKVSKTSLERFTNAGNAKLVSDDFLITRDAPENGLIHLGTVKGRYEVIQNDAAFNFFDSIIGEGHAYYETAGALFSGKKVWILADIPGAAFGKDSSDETKVKVLLSNSHDGTGCLTARITPIRVVCNNTYSLAVKGGKNIVKIRHLKEWNSEAKIAQAREVLGITKQYGEILAKSFEAFRAKSLDKDAFIAEFVDKLYPEKGDEAGKGKARAANIRAEIIELFSTGAGNEGKTVWDAFNAVTEFANHKQVFKETELSSYEENRFVSIFDGNANTLMQKAYDLSEALVA